MQSSLAAFSIGCLALLQSISVAADSRSDAPAFDIVAVLSTNAMTLAQKSVMVAEVNRIWTRAGVRVIWAPAPAVSPPPALSVFIYVSDRVPVSSPDVAQPLGAVPRVDGRLRPVIFVARAAVHDLIDAAGMQRVGDPFDRLYGRLVGRVIAHELGHLLLDSGEHREAGLMRAKFLRRDVLTTDERGFHLDADDLTTIRRHLSAPTLVARTTRRGLFTR